MAYSPLTASCAHRSFTDM